MWMVPSAFSMNTFLRSLSNCAESSSWLLSLLVTASAPGHPCSRSGLTSAPAHVIMFRMAGSYDASTCPMALMIF